MVVWTTCEKEVINNDTNSRTIHGEIGVIINNNGSPHTGKKLLVKLCTTTAFAMNTLHGRLDGIRVLFYFPVKSQPHPHPKKLLKFKKMVRRASENAYASYVHNVL